MALSDKDIKMLNPLTTLPPKKKLFKYVMPPVLLAVATPLLFTSVFFYNEAGYMTHVRTIFGDEKIVEDVGYSTKWFGRATTWKKAISVQSVLMPDKADSNPENDALGATIETFPIVFLGNVDAKVESSARFRLPPGDAFLTIAQEYRNPDNFIRSALLPAIKETLQATASLMTADDYYAGARSEFAAEFENQLNDGLYLIKRKEIRVSHAGLPQQTAILQAGTEQGSFGTNTSSQFITEKVTDSKNIPIRKQQQFRKFGVEVVEARITNIDPNPQYKQRMVKVQQALAELAVARQNRLKEEEEKRLVTARGEKEVEAKRQETLRDQIERTTQAETEKQLAVINAERERRRAEIEKQTAELLRDKATTTAAATKITADAEAHAREATIKADGALQAKLDALIEINKAWAQAAAQAPVPSVTMGAGQSGSTGRQDEISQLMGVLATKAARDMALDLKLNK
jgi:regulator of protease activity HflC (stomatin/prohibitin superfamily)